MLQVKKVFLKKSWEFSWCLIRGISNTHTRVKMRGKLFFVFIAATARWNFFFLLFEKKVLRKISSAFFYGFFLLLLSQANFFLLFGGNKTVEHRTVSCSSSWRSRVTTTRAFLEENLGWVEKFFKTFFKHFVCEISETWGKFISGLKRILQELFLEIQWKFQFNKIVQGFLKKNWKLIKLTRKNEKMTES